MRVVVGTESVQREVLYGGTDGSVIDRLQERLHQGTEMLTDAGRRIMDRAVDVFNRYSSHDAVRRARRAIRSISVAIGGDSIASLDDMLGLQLASPRNQRFIMAEPETRRRYLDQRVDGYSDSYINRHFDRVGRDHYDYRLATNGMVVETEEAFSVTHYQQELAEWDEPLTKDNQFDINRNFAKCRAALTAGLEDHTSRFGNML